MKRRYFLTIAIISSKLFSLEFDSSSNLVNDLMQAHCEKASTTLSMNNCTSEVYDSVDAELNRVYKVIKEELKVEKNEEEINTLKSAQRSWIDFRDKDSSLVYQHWITGSIRTMNAINRKIDLTLARIYDLKNLYLHMFYVKLKSSDISGLWVDVENSNLTLNFKTIKNKNTYTCILKKESHEGTFEIADGFIDFGGKTCGFGSTQRAYLTAFPKSGPDQRIELQFLADGGGTKYRFRKKITE